MGRFDAVKLLHKCEDFGDADRQVKWPTLTFWQFSPQQMGIENLFLYQTKAD